MDSSNLLGLRRSDLAKMVGWSAGSSSQNFTQSEKLLVHANQSHETQFTCSITKKDGTQLLKSVGLPTSFYKKVTGGRMTFI